MKDQKWDTFGEVQQDSDKWDFNRQWTGEKYAYELVDKKTGKAMQICKENDGGLVIWYHVDGKLTKKLPDETSAYLTRYDVSAGFAEGQAYASHLLNQMIGTKRRIPPREVQNIYFEILDELGAH